MNNRGIIITPPFEFGTSIIKTKDITDNFDIRQYLLYWDKIDFPDNNIVSINPDETPEVKYLKDVGILEQSFVKFVSYSCGDNNIIIDMQMEVLKYRNQKEPGCWSLAQSGRSLQFPYPSLQIPCQSSEESRTIQVELYKALPVPPNTASLEDILNFKEKRKDELLHFRFAMDKLYERVINSGDISHTKNSVIEELQKTIIDLNKVFNETWSSRLLSRVKALVNPKFNLNINDFKEGFKKGCTFTGALSLTNPLTFEFTLPISVAGGVAGGLLFCINIEPIVTLQPKNLPKELRDYAYLIGISQQFK